MSLIADQLAPFLGKRFPAALVAAFLLQSAGALFWAGSAAQRIGYIERAQAKAQSAIERIAVLEEQIAEIRAALGRIETKMDK